MAMNEEPFVDTTPPDPYSTGEAFKDLAAAARRAFKAGKKDASQAARDSIPRLQKELEAGAHDLAYGVAYAATFASTIAKQFAPEVVSGGFAEGAAAGSRAAESMTSRRRDEQAGDGAPDAGPATA
jgi:hypothetical protein